MSNPILGSVNIKGCHMEWLDTISQLQQMSMTIEIMLLLYDINTAMTRTSRATLIHEYQIKLKLWLEQSWFYSTAGVVERYDSKQFCIFLNLKWRVNYPVPWIKP